MVVVHVVSALLLWAALVAATTAPKQARSRHPRAGRVYVVLLTTTLVTGSAIGLSHPGITFFEIATPPTLALGLMGWWAARSRPDVVLGLPWLAWHVIGVVGSIIGVATASAFQIVPRLVDPTPALLSLALWVVPTVVGSAWISSRVTRIAQRYDDGARRTRDLLAPAPVA